MRPHKIFSILVLLIIPFFCFAQNASLENGIDETGCRKGQAVPDVLPAQGQQVLKTANPAQTVATPSGLSSNQNGQVQLVIERDETMPPAGTDGTPQSNTGNTKMQPVTTIVQGPDEATGPDLTKPNK